MMHRFFVSPDAIQGNTVTLPEPAAHQIRNVLRMRAGAHIVVLDNRGWEYTTEIIEIERKYVTGQIIEKQAAQGEPRVHLTLYQAILKRHNFELVLQKCTEIGVTCFVPMITERTVVSDVKESKRERWERIVTEAAEQSRRGKIPELRDPLEFEHAVSELSQYEIALIPYENEQDTGLRDILRPNILSAAVLIGPEGGFSEQEIALAHHASPITLGARILRAETAAIVASTLILYELENA
ncbi:MAG: 16S rRNA (uracil(1498)-N(3))-methyltransferase [Anaerolineae bacterium]|nr:16S rRNA (uracil(1498)-N(3))-methyltransferase [Anaerolineae bacterium]